MIINNYEELLSHGDVISREFLLYLANETLTHESYVNRILETVKIVDHYMYVKGEEFDLNDYKNIFLISGGKYSAYMAKAMSDILGSRLKGGIVIDKKDYTFLGSVVKFFKGGHPVPTTESFKAGKEVLNLISNIDDDDLLIVCVSGGWTSLVIAVPDNIDTNDVIRTYNILLESGMPINNMNAIRDRISKLAGGKLVSETKCNNVIGLISVDEVGGLPWGPTVADNISKNELNEILNRYGLTTKLPRNILNLLEDFTFDPRYDEMRLHNYAIENNNEMCEFVQNLAISKGIDSYILTTRLEGEAKEVGIFLAQISKEISINNRPFKHPCLIIVGGETTVTISEKHGKGGRNQELVLSALTSFSGIDNIAMLSIGTDGTDGPTEIAGAIIDRFTPSRVRDLNLNLWQELRSHNSSKVFEKLADVILTNDTVTNLMDLILIYIV